MTEQGQVVIPHPAPLPLSIYKNQVPYHMKANKPVHDLTLQYPCSDFLFSLLDVPPKPGACWNVRKVWGLLGW